MRTKHVLAALVVISAAGLLAGCSSSSDSAQTADELYQEGVSYLEDSMSDVDIETPPWEWSADMEEANGFFEDALDQDPDHCGALLMAALTRIVMVLQDPELGEILDEMFPEELRGGPEDLLLRAFQKPNVYGVRRLAERARRGEFHFSELQDYIEDEVNPALEYADAKLSRFEDLDCEVILEIDMERKRETAELEIDATDVYIVHAALDVVQATLQVAVSYNVDVEDGQTLQDLIDVDPDFLSLRPGDHMGAAYDELLEASGHLSDGATSLAGETDPQDTDLLTASDDEGWLPMGEGAADTLAMIASDMYDALTSGVTFNPWEDTGDPEAPDIDVLVDLEEFFADPLDPLTDYVPAHTWPDPDTIDFTYPYVFPDPTFSDVTPGMTNQDWTEILDWLE